MRISRDKYLNDLVARKGNGMVKVVTGARRCGKTYLLFDLFEDHLRAQGVDADHTGRSDVRALPRPARPVRLCEIPYHESQGTVLRAAGRGAVRDLGRGDARRGAAPSVRGAQRTAAHAQRGRVRDGQQLEDAVHRPSSAAAATRSASAPCRSSSSCRRTTATSNTAGPNT